MEGRADEREEKCVQQRGVCSLFVSFLLFLCCSSRGFGESKPCFGVLGGAGPQGAFGKMLFAPALPGLPQGCAAGGNDLGRDAVPRPGWCELPPAQQPVGFTGPWCFSLDISPEQRLLRRVKTQNCCSKGGFFCSESQCEQPCWPACDSGLVPRVSVLFPLVFGAGGRSHLVLETASCSTIEMFV